MMKKLTMILVALMVSSIGYAQVQLQDRDVPAEVTAALVRKFPEAKEVKWYKDSTGNFNGNFKYKVDKYNYSLLVTPSGNINKTESDVDAANLPKAILDYLNTNYPKIQINKAKRTDILIDSKGTVLYTVELQNKLEPLVFDANGNIVQ
jgi:hypothetical protein